MVLFTFEGSNYNFNSGSKVLAYARTNWNQEFARHTKFVKAYEEAAFRERNPEGYEVVNPRTKKRRWVTKEEAYTKPKIEAKFDPKITGKLGKTVLTTVDPSTTPSVSVPSRSTTPQATTKTMTFASVTDITNKNLMSSIYGMGTSFNLLSEVSKETGDIDNEGEAVEMQAVLDNYIKSVDKVVSAYGKQASEMMKAYYDNLKKFEDVLADKDKYTPESIAGFEKGFRAYEKDVVNAVAEFKKNSSELEATKAGSALNIEDISQWLKARKDPTVNAPIYTVTYIADNREKKRTFPSKAEADKFTGTLQNKQMKDAGFDGTWVEFTRKANNQKAYISWLTAKGVIDIDKGKAIFIKPMTVLNDEEIDVARKAGFDIPEIPLGASLSLYQWGQDTFPEGSFAGESVEVIASGLGQFIDVVWAPYRFVASVIPGLPYEKGFRGVTPDTMKYLEDLTPTQQTALDVGGLAATVGASYLASLPIGLTARGATSMASAISQKLNLASKLHLTSPKALNVVKQFLVNNPKVMQAVLWAPMAGMEASRVYQQIQDNVPVEEIIREEAFRLARIYGGLKGFKAGYNLIPVQKWARLQKLIKIEEVIDPKTGRKRLLPTIDSKKIPKELADLLRIELDPISGKEIVVGPATEGALTENVGRKYGMLLKDLVAGKAVTTDPVNAVRGAILKYATPDQLGYLQARGLNIEMMRPEQIAELMLKELNWGAGSPWAEMLKNAEFEYLKGTTKTTVDVLSVFSPSTRKGTGAGVSAEGILGTTKGQNLYSMLTSGGMSQSEALAFATEILTSKPATLMQVATEAGLSHGTKQMLAEASLTYSTAGASMVESLSKAGLTIQQTKAVVPFLIQQSVSPAFVVQELPKLGMEALAVVVPMLDSGVLQRSLPQVSMETLVRVAPMLDLEIVERILPQIDQDALIKVIPVLNLDIFTSVIPSLKPIDLSASISELSREQVGVLIDLIPDLTLDQIAYTVPKLSQESLNMVLETMAFDVPSLIIALDLIPPGVIPRLRTIQRIRKAFKEKRSRVQEPYKVVFRYLHANRETRRVTARSFREALIIGWKLKKNPSDPSEVEVEKISVR